MTQMAAESKSETHRLDGHLHRIHHVHDENGKPIAAIAQRVGAPMRLAQIEVLRARGEEPRQAIVDAFNAE